MQQTMRHTVTPVSTALVALTAVELYARTRSAGRIELHMNDLGEGTYTDWAIGDRPASFAPDGIGINGSDDTFVLVNFIAGVPARGKRQPATVILGYVFNGKEDVAQGLLEQFADTVVAAMGETSKPIYRNATGSSGVRRYYAAWTKTHKFEPLQSVLEMTAIAGLDVNVWGQHPELVAVGIDNETVEGRFVLTRTNVYSMATKKTQLFGEPVAIAIAKNGTLARVFKDGDFGTVLEVKLTEADDYTVIAVTANPTSVRIRTTEHEGPTYLYAYDPNGGVIYLAKVDENVGRNDLMTATKPAGTGNFHGVAENPDGLAFLVFEGLDIGDETDDSVPAAWTLASPDFTVQTAAQ